MLVTDSAAVPVTFVLATDYKNVTFSPTNFNEVGPHPITIDLQDADGIILSKTLTVTVTNTAPHFTVPSFAVLKSLLNSVSSRQITEMIDYEYNPITLSATWIVSGTN